MWSEPERDVVVVGAGIGGLSAALHLAAAGASVLVLDRHARPGGKMRVADIDGRRIDAGPTVLTMRGVFDDLFEAARLRLDEHLHLRRLGVVARHAWPDGTTLDLHAEPEHSAAAIGNVFGATQAEAFRRFHDHARQIYGRVEEPFVFGDGAGIFAALRRAGWGGAVDLFRVDWHRTLWRALGSFFDEPKLQQLFARYATYYGSSPFEAPGTLALIAHVEQRGVWTVEGGMIALADALVSAIEQNGGELACGVEAAEIIVEGGCARGVRLRDGVCIRARSVVANCDPRALQQGMLGAAVGKAVDVPRRTPRSLSAMTFCMLGRPEGFPLAFHNVFFSDDYRAEFEQLRAGRLPVAPTVYLCASDRAPRAPSVDAPERLMCLVNAPARADERDFAMEVDACQLEMMKQLRRFGLRIATSRQQTVVTTPNDFDRMFPGSGGALYGSATHGAIAPFFRPGARTRVPGLYLAGGGVHPGAGVPMAALSGRLAARAMIEDRPSMRRSPKADTSGGTSTESATTGGTP